MSNNAILCHEESHAHVTMEGKSKHQEDYEPIQAQKENHKDCLLMHIKVDLISNKLGLKLYTPHPHMGIVDQTSKSHGKGLAMNPKAKGQSGANQVMRAKGFNEGGVDFGQAPSQ